ncbi:MAG: hypothetical protein ISS81_05340 [Candidatus Marinimicrobia bacterium]|nr:hypothetical protein [Candidatus Neomarinimicrobiota bacterium]
MINKSFLNTKNHFTAAEYFLKIFDIKEQKPSLKHVLEIIRQFSKLPYENLSKILKLNKKWDDFPNRFPEEIISDYDQFRLGGTCFSLIFFLKTILDFYEYETHIIMADMKSGKNSHCALILKYNSNEFLLDPGYLIHKPLLISKSPGNQNLSFIPASLVYNTENDKYSLFTFQNKNLKLRYSFRNISSFPETFLKFWNSSFHWRTMHGICLSKRDEISFTYLYNHYLKREGAGIDFKGNFLDEIPEVVNNLFNIPSSLVQKAEKALKNNLIYDKELGYKVPKWVSKR